MLRRLAYLCHKGAKIGYISDVHTEFRKTHESVSHIGPEKCDVLVLAGDIGNPFKLDNSYRRFLEACTEKAKHTLVVAGNHEYYQDNRYSMGQTKTKIMSVCDLINRENKKVNYEKYRNQTGPSQPVSDIIQNETNNNISTISTISTVETSNTNNLKGDIHFLDDTTFTYNIPFSQQSIRFIGSTLWSYISPEHENEIYKCINDYEHIMGFTPKMSRLLYRRATEFINNELASHNDDNTVSKIVVTHYPPTTLGVSDPKFDGSNLQTAFSTDFLYYTDVIKPHVWIFGHTHYNVNRLDTTLGTLLLSNQVGYPNEHTNFIN